MGTDEAGSAGDYGGAWGSLVILVGLVQFLAEDLYERGWVAGFNDVKVQLCVSVEGKLSVCGYGLWLKG